MNTPPHHSKVLILGSGPAGCTAAMYTARANLTSTLIHGFQPGGQLTITTDVENYPGFEDTIQGPWLMEQMERQAKKVGAIFIQDHIVSVNLSARPFTCIGESGAVYTSDALIVATGAQAKWLGIPSEEKFRGAGVSGCATCDGRFFTNQAVLVVGGGNTAVEEALHLTHHASEITLVHRRDSLRAEKILQDRLFAHPKIKVIWDHTLDEVLGTDTPLSVTGARLKHVATGKTHDLAVEGVFIAIGHKPNTALFTNQLAMDAEGYIITTAGSTRTSVPGVFAAGDVQDKLFRQAATAVGTGCMAALEVEKYLAALPNTNNMCDIVPYVSGNLDDTIQTLP